MSLLNIFEEFACRDTQSERVIFESSMIEKLRTEPYKMSDLLWEVYQCQRELEFIRHALIVFAEEFIHHLKFFHQDPEPRQPAAKTKTTPKKKK